MGRESSPVKIYQINLDDDRLGRNFDPLPEAIEAATPYLLIVHPGDADRSISIDLPEWLSDSNCSSILYVKGVPRAGLSSEDVRRIEAETHQRVHFLSYAIGARTDLTGELGDFFSRFFDAVESQDKVDWTMIEEPTPENLLAIYFLTKAITCSNLEGAKMLLAERPRWLKVWQAAETEYYLRSSRKLGYEDLSAENAVGVAKQVRPYLEESACRIDNQATSVCKDLRHNWLGHEVLPFDAEYISRLYVGASPMRDRFEERIKPGGSFTTNMSKVNALSMTIVDGFSPAQQIDDGPLCVLRPEARALIKTALHKNYLEQTEIAVLAKSIQVAQRDLSSSYERFLADWYNDPKLEQARIKEGFEQVQYWARILFEFLGKLPKGVVLS